MNILFLYLFLIICLPVEWFLIFLLAFVLFLLKLLFVFDGEDHFGTNLFAALNAYNKSVPKTHILTIFSAVFRCQMAVL